MNESRQFLQTLLISCGLMLGGAALERLEIAPAGFLVGMVECCVEILALISLLVLLRTPTQSRLARLQITLLATALIFLCVAELLYDINYYYLQTLFPTFFLSLFITGSYALFFFLICLFFILFLSSDKKRFLLQPLSALAFLVTVAIGVSLGFPIFEDPKSHPFGLFFVFVEIASLLISYWAFLFGILSFLGSNDMFWTRFSSGLMITLLGSWAIKVEKLLGNEITFVNYEYIWGLGIIFFCLSILSMKRQPSVLLPFDRNSLASNGRLFSLFIAFVTLILTLLVSQGQIDIVKATTVIASIGILTSGFLGHYLLDKLRLFSEELVSIVDKRFLPEDDQRRLPNIPTELSTTFKATFDRKVEDLKLKNQQQIHLENAEEKAAVFSQVAHDIRSPVFALRMATQNLPALPQETITLIKNAIHRISDIADDLLAKNRSLLSPQKSVLPTPMPVAPLTTFLVSNPIEAVVREKQTQLKDQPDLKIDFSPGADSRKILISANESDFKRVLSNLIDNAIEAIALAGNIKVTLSRQQEEVLIRIQDTGCGIPERIVANLGSKPFTFGKKDGNGLGIYSAKSRIAQWGGSIQFLSEKGQGTEVVVSLPRPLGAAGGSSAAKP